MVDLINRQHDAVQLSQTPRLPKIREGGCRGTCRRSGCSLWPLPRCLLLPLLGQEVEMRRRNQCLSHAADCTSKQHHNIHIVATIYSTAHALLTLLLALPPLHPLLVRWTLSTFTSIAAAHSRSHLPPAHTSSCSFQIDKRAASVVLVTAASSSVSSDRKAQRRPNAFIASTGLHGGGTFRDKLRASH